MPTLDGIHRAKGATFVVELWRIWGGGQEGVFNCLAFRREPREMAFHPPPLADQTISKRLLTQAKDNLCERIRAATGSPEIETISRSKAHMLEKITRPLKEAQR